MFKGGMASMMQKAQKMQQNVKNAQEEIKNSKVIGKSGTQISLTMNGEYQVSDIQIDDIVLTDKEMMISMLEVAINDATSQIQTISAKKMKTATGGIGDMNLPF
jgi:DNA-binding YbaB/EbfC family protein